MSFYNKRRKKVNVQIIPMIDLLTILLIFFVLTTTWRKSESHINVNLPKANSIASTSEKTINRIIISVTKEKEIYIGENKIDIKKIPDHIKLLKKDNPNLKLELKADQTTPLQTLVNLWDVLKKSGYNISDLPTKMSSSPKTEKNN